MTKLLRRYSVNSVSANSETPHPPLRHPPFHPPQRATTEDGRQGYGGASIGQRVKLSPLKRGAYDTCLNSPLERLCCNWSSRTYSPGTFSARIAPLYGTSGKIMGTFCRPFHILFQGEEGCQRGGKYAPTSMGMPYAYP